MDLGFLTGTDWLHAYIIPWGGNVLGAALVLLAGRILARMACRAVGRVAARAGVEPTLARFLDNVLKVALLAVVIVAALDQLGVQTASALAVFATAGLAVGLALKDSLSDLASGVMLILLKPFKVGDTIEGAGVLGKVEAIQMADTVLLTPDNRRVTVPNSALKGGIIVNFTAMPTRRIDMVFGIGYGDDVELARRLITEVLEGDPRVLAEPAPFVKVMELGESSVNIAVRPWVPSEHFWDVHCDLHEKIKAAFDAGGVSIPFPQRDVHLRGGATAP
ncbi:MAG: mechanosensitive ion channel [Nitrospirae bacterium]|nr:mechanosensitive ion channel [Nitrospirota bacterium]